MSSVVDLRSDTVTRPGEAMRAAIAAADVGDDVHGDDPTVNRLQQRAAELLGKEAALYVPSGTMANQVAIRAVCEPGDEIVIDALTHCFNYESGAPAALSGVSIRTVRGQRGIFTGADIAAAVRGESIHFARPRMVVVENTNNSGGGSIWPTETLADVRRVATDLNLHVHMDGARLMNACVARGLAPTSYTTYVDTVSMCFSKGLGAPVGSIVAGAARLIERMRRFRKMFGGAMRQAGLLAAGALYALDHNVVRLAEDHTNARRLATALAEMRCFHIDPTTIDTNIVIFEVDPRLGSAAEVVAELRRRNVWVMAVGPHALRAVTHLDVPRDQIEQAIRQFQSLSDCGEVP